MSELKLGQLITDHQERDAIHIAVVPVTAGAKLFPGRGVGFEKDSTERVQHYGTTFGIVDPFLSKPVEPEERCWVFLYPNTVTGMRHHWQHPLFPDAMPTSGKDRSVSEQWLRNYAAEMNCYDEPEKAYQDLINGLRTGELYAHGSDLHGLYELDQADELRQHAEAVLGITINWGNFTFSCSC